MGGGKGPGTCSHNSRQAMGMLNPCSHCSSIILTSSFNSCSCTLGSQVVGTCSRGTLQVWLPGHGFSSSSSSSHLATGLHHCRGTLGVAEGEGIEAVTAGK